MTHTLILLLDASYALLGEVALDSGALANVMLTDTGEERIGAQVRAWQTRGVPARRELFGTKQHPNDVIFFQERVQPRDRKFGEALLQWAEDQRVMAVRLSSSAMDCWNKVLRLPFLPQERLAILMALSKTDAAQLSPWHAFLDEAVSACETEMSKAEAAIAKLRQKAAEGLVKRFSKERAGGELGIAS